ncbi:hypothetical protein D3C85_1344620 [compost metagenome]
MAQPVRPAAPEPEAPVPLGQLGNMEEDDVPGGQRLPQRGAPLRPGAPPRRAQRAGGMVEARPRARGERRDAPVQARVGHEFPALDRSPVMANQMHAPIWRHGVDDRDEIVGKALQPVVVHARRHV